MLSDVLIFLVTMKAITIVIIISLKYQVTDFNSERFLLSPTTYSFAISSSRIAISLASLAISFSSEAISFVRASISLFNSFSLVDLTILFLGFIFVL